MSSSLHTLYREYLRSNLTPDAAITLAAALRHAGLGDAATALNVYAERGLGATYVIPDGAWQGRLCVVADDEPSQAEPGTFWFDLTELTHMVFISTGARYKPSFWLAVHPVYVWQWRAFLDLVTWKKELVDIPADVMSPERFAGGDDMAFVINMYHEEAAAYAVWLRKRLASRLLLSEAQAFFSPEIFSRLRFDVLHIWDGGSPKEPENELYRQTAGVDTLDFDYGTRARQLHFMEFASPKDIPDPVRVFFEVWERSEKIGCMTALLPVFYDFMRRVRAPMSAFHYALIVTSFAPRPSLDSPRD
ncbi:MAG: hypothetical protein M5U05_17920 [Anaerolineales bacterium]|nr:hypothetical protein [Anaerolineales bacterium]